MIVTLLELSYQKRNKRDDMYVYSQTMNFSLWWFRVCRQTRRVEPNYYTKENDVAYLEYWKCSKCNEEVYSDIPRNRICHICQEKIDEENRRKHFDSLDKLTIEERIRNIEEWIYDHSHGFMIENIMDL